jgi:hypothetical protein
MLIAKAPTMAEVSANFRPNLFAVSIINLALLASFTVIHLNG